MSCLHRPLVRPSTLALCGAAAAWSCMPPDAHAEESLLRVTAVVARRATISVAQPRSMLVTAEDIARGWLEWMTPIHVRVRSNAPEGYTLVFERSGTGVREVQVLGLGAPLVFAAGQAMGSRPAPQRGFWTDEVMLRFRFALPPGTAPGEHAWPVRISLLPS